MTPYNIIHIHLELQVDTYDYISEHTRYYFLLWWRQVPLGCLYIEEEEKLDRNELQLKIIRAIKPGVDFYQSNGQFPEKNYINAYLNNNQQDFETIMDEIFLPYNAAVVHQKLDITVIICTHNRSGDLFHCLKSLHSQTCLPQEIIVIDNAPADHSTKVVVEKFPGVIYYREERMGLSIARNAGVRLANTPIIAFVDDDVIVHKLWLLRVWETFLSPEVKAMTGLVMPTSLETESQQIFEKCWGFTKSYCDNEFSYSFIEKNLKKAPPVWSIGAGANMAFRKSVFDNIGYFDERLGAGLSGCSEDSELWFRMLLNGYRIHYNPRAVTFHTHRKELKSLRKQLFDYARGHVTAALIQQLAIKDAGYKRRVFVEYPKYYLRRLIKGFPLYRFKNKTLLSEILGWFAGIRLFKKVYKMPQSRYGINKQIITEAVNSSKAI